MRNHRKLASAISHGRWGEKTPKIVLWGGNTLGLVPEPHSLGYACTLRTHLPSLNNAGYSLRV